VDFPSYFWHVGAWIGPSVALTLLALLWTAWRRSHAPRWGWWGSGLALLGAGVGTQWVVVFVLNWPDGSMAGYALLVLVLATAQTFCVRKHSLATHQDPI